LKPRTNTDDTDQNFAIKLHFVFIGSHGRNSERLHMTQPGSVSLPRTIAAFLVTAFAVGVIACGSDDGGGGGTRSIVVFAPETNRLNAYDVNNGFAKQVVIPSHDDDPQNGLDINGMVCFTRHGERRFVAGEDTGQPVSTPGWGYFQLVGDEVGEYSASEIGKMIPTYQEAEDNREPYGCGFLNDGRLLTTDVGNQASGPPTGQLILWFPPYAGPFGSPRYCKLDIAIGTAGGIYVDAQDRVYVASARGDEFGVLRYSPPFPASDDAAGGCGRTDDTGAPLATSVTRERFIAGSGNLPAPSGISQSPEGTLYVSSVINGVINEYDAGGALLRRVLMPASGERAPFSTGTPFGLAIDSEGSLYYADLGIVISLPDIGPGPNLGTLRRIRFAGGEPQAPETIDSGLNFPDGVAVLEE
jgi:hypothetical protein